jgi:hypothetical protein
MFMTITDLIKIGINTCTAEQQKAEFFTCL